MHRSVWGRIEYNKLAVNVEPEGTGMNDFHSGFFMVVRLAHAKRNKLYMNAFLNRFH